MGVDYALELSYVKEIQRIVEITRLNELPNFVKGVINIRGEIIPVIDFNERAGLEETSVMLSSRLIVVVVFDIRFALLVDSVFGVIALDKKSLSKNLDKKIVISPRYIQGVFVHYYVNVVLVDIEAILSSKDFQKLDKASKKPKK